VIQFGSKKTNSCPPQMRAASTIPTLTNEGGFVEASPSRVLRDGEGTSVFKLAHSLEVRELDIGGGGIL